MARALVELWSQRPLLSTMQIIPLGDYMNSLPGMVSLRLFSTCKSLLVGEERRPPSNISVRPIGDTVAVVEGNETLFDTRPNELLLVGTDGRAPLAIDSRSIGDTATPFIPTEGVGHASGDLYDVPAVQRMVRSSFRYAF